MTVEVSDFHQYGKYELGTGNYDEARLVDYIARYTRQYLAELMGAKLFDVYEAQLDLSGASTQQRFIELEEPFTMDISTFNQVGYFGNGSNVFRRVIISNGMKDMLMAFIYFEYLKDSISVATPIGIVQPSGENSKTPNTLHVQIYTRYNDGVRTWRAIQERIVANPNDLDYTDFNGVNKMLTSWL